MRHRLIALVGALLVVSACQPATSPAASPGASAGGAVKGGTLVFAIWQEPTTLAPHYVNQTVAGLVSQVCVEGLGRTDTDGNYQPMLAARIPTVENGGAKLVEGNKKLEVTWQLQPGLKWSNAQPLTSADIAFTWQTWMKDPKVLNRQGFDQIEKIDTPNDTTAVVTYKSIYAPYATNFNAGLLPKNLLEKEADISKTEYVRKPLCTGPFVVADFKAGDSITMERNPNYRKAGQPHLDKIIFRSVPSSEAAIAQLKAGEVQGMWNILESQTPDLEKDSNLKLAVSPSPSVERIEMNTAKNEDMTDPSSVHPILGDINVRRALIYATPKQVFVDKLLFGKAKAGTSVLSQGWAADRSITQESYDPKMAAQLLDQSGWVKGADGIRAKGGVRFSLTITTTTGNKTREQVETILVDEWKQIGVELKIQNLPSSVLLSGSWTDKDPRKRGNFDLIMYASSPAIDPQTTMETRYHSKNIPSKANNGVGQNYTRVKDPNLDQAIDDAGATLEVAKRKEAYSRALKLLNQNATLDWLYDRASIDAFRANVFGWQTNIWDNITWNTEDWFIKP
ncbi:MAG: hypothetical protein AUH85_08835 [Chloroflexi bacterium 13_1_40CM_4_68_4]|nr:MAG: hypothetical protein AUH85_08835 [Chloroflexi bacterium 13_1_40CM_4_68_4]